MKKVLAVVLLLAVLASSAAAEYAAYSTEELHTILDAVRNELTRRELNAQSNTLLFDDQGVQIYMTGSGRPWEYGGRKYFDLELIVINNTEKNIIVEFYDVAVNGWDEANDALPEVSAGKKKKDCVTFSLTDANLQDYTEITDVEMSVQLRVHADTFFKSEPINIDFNW